MAGRAAVARLPVYTRPCTGVVAPPTLSQPAAAHHHYRTQVRLPSPCRCSPPLASISPLLLPPPLTSRLAAPTLDFCHHRTQSPNRNHGKSPRIPCPRRQSQVADSQSASLSACDPLRGLADVPYPGRAAGEAQAAQGPRQEATPVRLPTCFGIGRRRKITNKRTTGTPVASSTSP